MLKKKWECNEAVHQLFIDFKKAYDSVRKETLYNILIEFGIIPLQLVRLIKLRLSVTCSRVRVGKYFSDLFPIQNGLGKKSRCFMAITFQLCFRLCHYEGSDKPGWLEIERYTSASS